jgi:UDP-N-acetylglucosamine 2-epimerase (non-hydrolysing)
VKILSVVGARPQFVNLVPVDRELRDRGYEHVIVHTDQHYDRLMSPAFFDDLAIAPPIANPGIGSGSHADQTAGILTGLDPTLKERQPEWVLVYRDTNTTLGSALAATQRQLPLARFPQRGQQGNGA